MRGYDAIELQVNAKNRLAYEMYKNYGFTEKSINMELKQNCQGYTRSYVPLHRHRIACRRTEKISALFQSLQR